MKPPFYVGVSAEDAVRMNPAPPHPLASGYPLRVSWRTSLPVGFQAETVALQIERRLNQPGIRPWERGTLTRLLARLERSE